MTVFHSNEDAGQDGFLQGFIELEVELLELLADEADGQNRDFFYDEVFVAHVGSDLFGDAFPLLSRYFDAANRCDDVGSCSPDEFVLVDHGVDDHVLDGRFGGRAQPIPEKGVVGGIFLEGDGQERSCGLADGDG